MSPRIPRVIRRLSSGHSLRSSPGLRGVTGRQGHFFAACGLADAQAQAIMLSRKRLSHDQSFTFSRCSRRCARRWRRWRSASTTRCTSATGSANGPGSTSVNVAATASSPCSRIGSSMRTARMHISVTASMQPKNSRIGSTVNGPPRPCQTRRCGSSSMIAPPNTAAPAAATPTVVANSAM